MTETHAVFTQQHFYPALQSDIRSARGLLIIQSPYVTIRRLELLSEEILSAVQRGVTVCVFAEVPREWRSQAKELSPQMKVKQIAFDMLLSLGVHVILRKKIHEKLVIIDHDVFWEGSLNILSQYDSHERMNRWVSREKLMEAMVTHSFYTVSPLLGLKPIFQPEEAMAACKSAFALSVLHQRKLKKVSQNEMVRRTGIPRRGVGRIENREGNPSLDSLSKIASTLEMRLLPVPWYLVPSVELLLRRHFNRPNFDPSKMATLIYDDNFSEEPPPGSFRGTASSAPITR